MANKEARTAKKVSTILKKGSKNVRLRSRSAIRIDGSTDPDPKEIVTDPQYWPQHWWKYSACHGHVHLSGKKTM